MSGRATLDRTTLVARPPLSTVRTVPMDHQQVVDRQEGGRVAGLRRAIEPKRREGVWLEGVIWRKAQDGRIIGSQG